MIFKKWYTDFLWFVYYFRWNGSEATALEQVLVLANPAQPEGAAPSQGHTHTIRGLLDVDLCDQVVSVCGVLLPKLLISNNKQVS